MTLNLADLFATAIKKEMVISHFDGTVFGVKTSKLPGEWTSQIEDEYGEGFLRDANYVILFRKEDYSEMSETELKKLFDLSNRALGKASNNLTQGDFKKIGKTEKDDDESAKHFVFLKVTTK